MVPDMDLLLYLLASIGVCAIIKFIWDEISWYRAGKEFEARMAVMEGRPQKVMSDDEALALILRCLKYHRGQVTDFEGQLVELRKRMGICR